jgi:hypothetical protein
LFDWLWLVNDIAGAAESNRGSPDPAMRKKQRYKVFADLWMVKMIG